MLVVRDNFTKRDQVRAAFEQLRKADANVIGAVLNDCEVESSEYYYAYYNKDGKRMKHGDSSPAAAQDTFDMDSSIVVPQNPRGSGL